MHKIDYNIEKKKLFEDVAEKLERYILENASKLGEKLPSEQSLANSFGVSRPVVREAMKLLKERQLIKTINGEGTYISKPSIQNLTELLNRMMLMDNIDYSQVFEMRLLLEPYACKLTAEKHIDEESIKVLTDTIENMILNEHNAEQRISYDLKFHAFISIYSGNFILSSFIQSMTELLIPIIKRALIPKGGHQSGVEYHKKIVDIIKTGDGIEAEKVMREHLVVSSKNYLNGTF